MDRITCTLELSSAVISSNTVQQLYIACVPTLHPLPNRTPIHLVTTMLSTLLVVVVDMPDFQVINTC